MDSELNVATFSPWELNVLFVLVNKLNKQNHLRRELILTNQVFFNCMKKSVYEYHNVYQINTVI